MRNGISFAVNVTRRNIPIEIGPASSLTQHMFSNHEVEVRKNMRKQAAGRLQANGHVIILVQCDHYGNEVRKARPVSFTLEPPGKEK